MSEEIIKVLDALAEKFGLAVDWTSANVIPYLEQLCGKYVNYEIATSIVWILLGIGLLVFAKFLTKRIKTFYEKSDELDPNNDYAWLCVLSSVVMVIAIIAGICIAIQQTFNIVTCFTFPEKIIIEELKSIYTSIK